MNSGHEWITHLEQVIRNYVIKTNMDKMFDDLKDGNLDITTYDDLKQYLNHEEYDTDAVIEDVDGLDSESNIYNIYGKHWLYAVQVLFGINPHQNQQQEIIPQMQMSDNQISGNDDQKQNVSLLGTREPPKSKLDKLWQSRQHSKETTHNELSLYHDTDIAHPSENSSLLRRKLRMTINDVATYNPRRQISTDTMDSDDENEMMPSWIITRRESTINFFDGFKDVDQSDLEQDLKGDDDQENENKHPEYSLSFSFGEYLNYWTLDDLPNTVQPKHASLRIELLKNEITSLSLLQCNKTYNMAMYKLQSRDTTLRANYIGINNQIYNIPPGTPITINHIISLMVYTDYTEVQREFKKTCRKSNPWQQISEVVKENSEIAHWCRYMKECYIFYGEPMSNDMIVYTGISVKLMIDSLQQYVQFPLSTTIDPAIADAFADGSDGIIWKMKRANSTTRFDIGH